MEKALLYFTLLFVVFSAAVRIGNFEFSVHQHDGAKEAMTLEDKRAKIENLQKKLECMQEMSLSVRKELVNPKTQEQLNLEASQNWAARAAEPDVQRDIYASQHPPDCRKAKIFLMDYANPHDCGHGCQVHYISLALSFAFMNGRTLIVNPKSFWLLRGDHRGEDFFQDYFEPLSSCTLDDIQGEQPKVVRRSSLESSARVIKVQEMWRDIQPVYNKRVPSRYRPNREANKVDEDLFWWRSQLVYYILRPLPETWKLIRLARDELCLEKFRPVVGVHLRQGSSVKKFGDYGRRKVFTPTEHFEAADTLVQRISDSQMAHQVLICTEYPEDVHELIKEHPARTFLHFSLKGMVADAHSLKFDKGIHSTDKKPYRDLHLIAIINLWSLIEADGLVVQLQSNYSRLILELLKAIGREVPFEAIGGIAWMVDP